MVNGVPTQAVCCKKLNLSISFEIPTQIKTEKQETVKSGKDCATDGGGNSCLEISLLMLLDP